MHDPDEIERLYRELAQSISPNEQSSPNQRGSRDGRSLEELVVEVHRLTATTPFTESTASEQHVPALPKTGEQHHSIERAAAHLDPSITRDASAAGPIEREGIVATPDTDRRRVRWGTHIRRSWQVATSALLVLLIAGGAISFIMLRAGDKTNPAPAPVPSAMDSPREDEAPATPVPRANTPKPTLPGPAIESETAAENGSAPREALSESQQPPVPAAAAEEPRTPELSGGITAPAGVTAAAIAASPSLDRPKPPRRLKKRRRAPVAVRSR